LSAPNAMPVISRDCPAFTNDDFSGAFPSGQACNSNYGNFWRCAATPSGGSPVYLAYDLSGVPSGQRGNVLLAWYNDPASDTYDHTLISVNAFNVPQDYTIDVNAGAGGGSPPGSSWTTVATVTGNHYHSRQHSFDMTGKNWVRINITGIDGSTLNENAEINMDIHDASGGLQDSWIIYGDSITQRGSDHDPNVGGLSISGTLPQLINAVKTSFFPAIEDGGIGGFSAADGAANIATWLPLFPGRFVGLAYGNNDANGGGPLTTNFQANMTTMINAVIGAGKIPVIPTVPWGGTTNLLNNVPTLNAVIAGLYVSFPSIVKGPDLYAAFNADHSLISGDNIHPTDPTITPGSLGYPTWRQSWANALIANVYSSSGSTILARGRRLGRVLP